MSEIATILFSHNKLIIFKCFHFDIFIILTRNDIVYNICFTPNEFNAFWLVRDELEHNAITKINQKQRQKHYHQRAMSFIH